MVAVETVREWIPRLEEADKAISAAVARDPIMWAQTSLFFQLGMRNQELMKQGVAAYNATMNAFRKAVVNLHYQYELKTVNFSQAVKEWKTLTGQYYQELFKAGAMTAGNPYYRDLGLSKKDLAFIAQARRAEQKYWENFLRDTDRARTGEFRPRHPLPIRASYYAESGKAQYFNGMVNGAGDNVVIHWVLGVAEHCDDCLALVGRTYTWKTLPTTPRAGMTACLFNCACHLEFQPASKAAEVVPGSGTEAALRAPGRWAQVFDAQGRSMSGEVLKGFEELFQQMNKARQMIELTVAEEQAQWIALRRQLNKDIIMKQDAGKYKALATVSVKDLVATVEGVRVKYPTGLLYPMDSLRAGDEVVWVRGDAFRAGLIKEKAGRLFVVTAKGEYIAVKDETDLTFLLAEKRAQIISKVSSARQNLKDQVGAALLSVPRAHAALVKDFYIVDKFSAASEVSGASVAYYHGALKEVVLLPAGVVQPGAIAHEVGHAVWDNLGMTPHATWKGFYVKMQQKQLLPPTSYARTDVTEFFAECYGHYFSGESVMRNRVPSVIQQWFSKWFGFLPTGG